ncbi:MAG: hypothetical protein ACI9SP_004602 [Arenicella sp.]|jgi:hypothetical protein
MRTLAKILGQACEHLKPLSQNETLEPQGI